MPSAASSRQTLESSGQSRMRGHDDALGVIGQLSDGADQNFQSLRVVDVLLAVHRDQVVAAATQAKPFESRRPLDLTVVRSEHLSHRRPGDERSPRRQALREQVPSGVLGVAEVEVGDVVDESAVRLLGHILVEAAVARLHVEDRDPQPLRHDGSDTAVGVPQDEHGIRTLFQEHRLDAGEYPAQNGTERGRVDVQEVVRLAQAQLVEEDVAEQVIPVLAGMHQLVVGLILQPGDHP